MKFFKKLTLLLFLASSLLVASPPAVSFAAGNSNVEACEAVKAINPGGSCEKNPNKRLSNIVKVVLSLLSFIAGIIAVIMLIVGGLKYVTSQGDGNAAASARNTILYAIIGLVIVVFAQIIVRFVLSEAT